MRGLNRSGGRAFVVGIGGLDRNFRTAVPDAVTMTQHFMKHGYRAEAVGKIFHTGHGNHDDDASWSVPSHKEKVVEYLDPENSANGQLTREEAFFTNQKLGEIKSLPRGAAIEVMDVPDNGYADGRIADEGIKRLRAAKERQHPFFLALGFPGLFDAWGKQIIAGIGWELVKECVALDGGTLPDFSSVPQRHWMMFTEPTQRTPAPSRRPT